MKNYFLLVCLLTLFSACKVVRYTPGHFPAKQLIFGKGGGFAGTETSYILLENGQIFRQNTPGGNYEELEPLKAGAARELFSKLSTLQLYKMDIEKPGNLYYFLRDANQFTDSKVIWGAGDYLPPQSLITFYQELQSMVKDRRILKKQSGQVKPKAEKPSEKKDKNQPDKW